MIAAQQDPVDKFKIENSFKLFLIDVFVLMCID